MKGKPIPIGTMQMHKQSTFEDEWRNAHLPSATTDRHSIKYKQEFAATSEASEEGNDVLQTK